MSQKFKLFKNVVSQNRKGCGHDKKLLTLIKKTSQFSSQTHYLILQAENK